MKFLSIIINIIVQWLWQSEVFGFQCRAKEAARSFSQALENCKKEFVNEPDTIEIDDDDKPLTKVNSFNPGIRRSLSLKKSNTFAESSSSTNSTSSSLLRMLEATRQEGKREREVIMEKLAKLEDMISRAMIQSDNKGTIMAPPNCDFDLPLPPPPPPEAAALLPPPPAPPSTTGAPPPPPPPLPTSSSGPTGGARKMTLAEQLQAAKLKKEGSAGNSTDGAPAVAAKTPPKMDFSMELQKTIKKWKVEETKQQQEIGGGGAEASE